MAAGETPVSWYLIAAGWEVLDRDGEAVGRVEEVVGTLAGDDTTLVVTQSAADARSLARELGELIGA